MKGLAKRLIAGFSAAALLVSAVGSDAFTRSLKRTIYADSADESGKWGSQDDFDDLEQDTRDSDGNKIYNTNYGLHTDKTVSKAYADGRTFDVDLESWYIGENPADVGMILDASGSMAWTMDTLEPLNILDEINKKENDDLEKTLKEKYSVADWDITALRKIQNEAGNGGYLPEDIAEMILYPQNTDNDKITYDDYSYYIYESRATVSEFVPLGFWAGDTSKPLSSLGKLIGYYPFEGSLDNAINDDEKAKGILIAHPDSSGSFKNEEISTVPAKLDYSSGGLDLTAADKYGNVYLDIADRSGFDFSNFIVEFEYKAEDASSSHCAQSPIFYIGTADKSQYYMLNRGSSKNNSYDFSDPKNKPTASNSNRFELQTEKGRIFQTEGKLTYDDFHSIKLEVKENMATVYIDGKAIGFANGDGTISSPIESLDDFVIMLGGDELFDQTEYSDHISQNYIKNFKITSNGKEFCNFGLTSEDENVKFVKQTTTEAFSTFDAPDGTPAKIEYSGTGYKSDNALDITETSKSGGVLLDAVPEDKSFTLSFAIKKADGTNDNKGENGIAQIMYIGNNSAKNNYYHIARNWKKDDTNGINDDRHLRFHNKDQVEKSSIADIKEVFDNSNSDDWDHVTYVFDNNKLNVYMNGAVAKDPNNKDLKEITLTDLGSSPINFIISGLEEKYSGLHIYLDELYVFDDALSAEDVESLYKIASGTAGGETVAYDPSGNVIATISKELSNWSDRRGWYYVNSSDTWKNVTDDKIATSKTLAGIRYEKNKGDGHIYDIANIPSGYTDTSKFAEIKKQIESANNTYFEFKNLSNGEEKPIKFYIDSAGYLRCFFNSGSNTDADKFSSSGASGNSPDARTQCSLVYYKSKDQKIKMQSLNDKLNTFVQSLQNSSEQSKVSALRFSNDTLLRDESKAVLKDTDECEENLKKLVLLDWVGKNDTNNKYSTDLAGKRADFDDSTTSTQGSMNNYFLTGGTNTWVGLKSFHDNLATDETISKDSSNKFLVLFTDGRDTLNSKPISNDFNETYFVPSGVTYENDQTLAKQWADRLKDEGYTIFCIMLSTGSVAPGTTDFKEARDFLGTIASDDKYVYVPSTDAEMQGVFDDILLHIKKPLQGYIAQDYIDPRFDLVDKEKGVLKLGAGGEIKDSTGTTLATVNASTGFDYTPKALSYGGGKDGKAKIYYDSEKDMYYLRWEVDSIGGANSPFDTKIEGKYLNESRADDPTTAEENEEQAGRWFSTITVKAKDDFIGGNAILTNGNEAGMNLVFASKELYKDGTALEGSALRDKLSSLSGTDKSQDRDEHGTETTVGSPAKGFPRVCVNVQLLPIETKPLHEVIYLGEVVSPTYMLSELENGYMEGSYYLEYLKRYAYRLYKDDAAINTPLLELLNQWLGIKDITKTEKTFTIPYIYLPEPQYKDDGTLLMDGEKVVVNNSSGTPDLNQKDIVGFLTYTWKRVDSTTDDIMKEFVVNDTNGVAYSLELKFTPLPQGEELTSFKLDEHFITDDNFFKSEGDNFSEGVGVSKWTFDTRDNYLQALVNEQHEVGGVTKNVYEWNAEYKPTAGNVQVENGQNYGDATISEDGNSLVADTTYTKDVVNAGLALELLVKGEDLDGSTTVRNGGTFTFTATRNYTDELDPLPYKTGTDANMSANADKEEYKLTFTIQDDLPTVTNNDSLYTIWAKLTKIKKGEDILDNGLPIGTYTIKYENEILVNSDTTTEVKFNNFNADNNRGNFVHTYFPDNVNSVSEEAVKDTDDEEYLIWDEGKDLDLAKENIAQNENKDNTLKFYFGTVPTKTINGKNLSNTKGDSVKDKPETTNDYAKDRLGIIMLSYGSSRLAISKEVTSKDIAVIKEQAVLDNFWNFDITLTFNEEQTDTPKYSLKCYDLATGKEITEEGNKPRDSAGKPITSLTFKNGSSDTEYIATISIKSNTQVILEQLPNDASYEVSEVRSKQEKDGDFRDTYRYNILVEGDGVDIASDQSKGTSKGELSPASAVNFINQFPSVMLPSSGGIGVDRYILFGTMLTVASALFIAKLWYDRRKRRATHGS